MNARVLAAAVVLVGATAALLWWARRPSGEPGGQVTQVERPAAQEETAAPSPEGDRPAETAPAFAQTPEPAPPIAAQARALVEQLAALLAREDRLSDEERNAVGDLEARLLAMGEGAAPALIERFDRGGAGSAARDRLFNLLRQVPGPAVEVRLAAEARSSPRDNLRTMAIESLAQRKTPQALDVLAAVAQNDPNLPSRPLIAQPRGPDDTGTEVPDEQVFTPRMQAMAALASTDNPRAAGVLAEVVQSGPDESLRMEAARNLKGLRGDARAAEALRLAVSNDPSAYVRLAALHAMQGWSDPALPALLQRIAANNRDAGVRILAQQIGTGLGN